MPVWFDTLHRIFGNAPQAQHVRSEHSISAQSSLVNVTQLCMHINAQRLRSNLEPHVSLFKPREVSEYLAQWECRRSYCIACGYGARGDKCLAAYDICE